MNSLLSFFKKYATLRNASIAFVILEIVVQILHKFDQPLLALTPGEGKLDLHSQYDITTVARLFDAYGQHGRTLHALDLLVDMLYPLFLSLSAILFTLVVIRHPFWQKLLILFPLVFVTMDVIENLFFFSFLWTYPSLSSRAVAMANIITRIKLFTIYITALELYLFALVAILLFAFNKVMTLRLAASHK